MKTKILLSLVALSLLVIYSFVTNPNTANKGDKKPFVIGETVTLTSKILNEERTLNIYLPEGYNPNDTLHYPVIYLLDGSADEDFIHVAGIVQYNNFPWINRFPKSIVVGIANVDRKRDFTFPTTVEKDKKNYPTTGGSANFIKFIEEVQIYITNSYKVGQTKTLIGQSLGGLLATEVLLKRPLLFDNYIIVSPSLWWNNGSLLSTDSDIMLEHYAHTTNVYIGVGKEGLAPTEEPHVMEVDANLLYEKISNTKSKNVTVHFDYLPDENHATVTHQAVFNAFRKLYPEKK
jgi:predicted alpha/beta superfamily hydrolase